MNIWLRMLVKRHPPSFILNDADQSALTVAKTIQYNARAAMTKQ